MTGWWSPVELIGYAASALVVCSLAMRSVVRLRAVSFVGSVVFVAYGALIGSIPIIAANAIIAVLNVANLRRELAPAARLGAVPIEPDAPFLTDFLDSHLADIRGSQPHFDGVGPTDTVLLLMRDGLPAGALAGKLADGVLRVNLDYVMRPYRDSRLGRWLFGDGKTALTRLGVRRVEAEPATAAHRAYLESIGFRPGGGRFVLDVE